MNVQKSSDIYEFPYPRIENLIPIWNGCGFTVGGHTVPVLSYSSNQSGWIDELTLMHEETAGSEHFIDQASREHALHEMKQYLPSNGKRVIMDIGCSTGFILQDYYKSLPDVFILGSDVIYEPLERLARRFPIIPLLHFDLVKCPLPDECLDGVSLINVLEHIENDQTALNQIYRILKPGGIAVIEVPSDPGLFDSYDRSLMHYRRYQINSLVDMARKSGFDVITKTHLAFSIFPGFWLVKKKNRLLDKIHRNNTEEKVKQDKKTVASEIKTTGGNSLLRKLMNLELRIGRYVSFPFGIRCLITLRKIEKQPS